MKNIVKISILSLVAFFASCANLDEVPVSQTSPDGFYQILDDVKPVINGTYGLMASSNYYGAGLTVPLMLMSDMVDNAFEYSDYTEFSPFIFTSNNSYVKNMWAVSYQVIATANSAIDGLAIIDEPNEDRRNRYIGEARFVRAFVYYHLVRLFGDIPYLASSELGDDLAAIKQTPASEVYDNIIADLTFAFDHLSTNPQGDIRSRPSKGTAAAYLASVHMTLGNWQQSYDNAKWVINNAGELNYALATDYQDLFRNSEQWSSQENIFVMDFRANTAGGESDITYENDGKIGPFNGVSGGDKPIRGWSMLVPHINVYNTWDASDYRLKVSMTDSLIMRDGTGIVRPYTEFDWPAPHIAKYNRFYGDGRSTAGWRSDLDYIAFRYAEVLLIAAEAANELGNTAEAVGYVNQVRSRARQGGTIDFYGNGYGSYGPSASPADVVGVPSQSDFRDLVLEERRIELSFEFKRWYDIVRRDLGAQVFGTSGLEPQPNFNSFRYKLPLPQGDMDRNSNFVQNPGY